MTADLIIKETGTLTIKETGSLIIKATSYFQYIEPYLAEIGGIFLIVGGLFLTYKINKKKKL